MAWGMQLDDNNCIEEDSADRACHLTLSGTAYESRDLFPA